MSNKCDKSWKCDSDFNMVDVHYSEELDAAEKQLERLRRRYTKRRVKMMALRPASGEKEPDMLRDRLGRGHQAPEQNASPETVIKQLLAEYLLDPSAKPPVDSQTLHKKVRRRYALCCFCAWHFRLNDAQVK